MAKQIDPLVGDRAQPAFRILPDGSWFNSLDMVAGDHPFQTAKDPVVQIQSAAEGFDVCLTATVEPDALGVLGKACHAEEVVADGTVHHLRSMVGDGKGD